MQLPYVLGPIRTLVILLQLFVIAGHPVCAQNTPHGKADDLFAAMQLEEGDWAADVGSGDGDYTVLMSEVVGDAGQLFAVDIDETELKELNDKIKDRGIENITTVFSVYDNPMLPSQSLDAALMRNAYHEFTAPESMLRHIKEGLKPGGRLVVEESVSEGMAGRSREAQTEEHDLGIEFARDELKAAGFEIEEEVRPFVEDESHYHWMIVATRPGP